MTELQIIEVTLKELFCEHGETNWWNDNQPLQIAGYLQAKIFYRDKFDNKIEKASYDLFTVRSGNVEIGYHNSFKINKTVHVTLFSTPRLHSDWLEIGGHLVDQDTHDTDNLGTLWQNICYGCTSNDPLNNPKTFILRFTEGNQSIRAEFEVKFIKRVPLGISNVDKLPPKTSDL
ncbi:hypothetical protein [Bacillus toyonensis]|uniref:hypothetical protein n=1 Tax=Bacillus toyonensis TaxID=155322 RepID=UPI000BEE0E8B|nr:hypothetical protein [Bacillus toyonensis]PEF77649.1 hypothetical protein CON80_29995 [Bacillus toyonensis]